MTMKKIWNWSLVVLLIGCLFACSEDEDLSVQPSDPVQTDLNIYADQSAGKLIFHARDAWSASISTETRAERLEWIVLGATSGEAGDIELPITVNRNRTGKERSAIITVFCGKTSTCFFVKQLGVKQDGTDGYQELPDIIPDDEKPATINPICHFVANEDWFGHRPGSITRFNWDGSYDYPAYANANTDQGLTLGVTTQFAMSWGGNLYMISKQGPRLVVADQNTLRMRASLDKVGTSDGRAACGVDAHTVYISTSSNIAIFDTDRMEVIGTVQGIEGEGGLYNGQVGDLVRSGDYVFAAIQGKGIAVVDCSRHQFVKILGGEANSGVCASRDGYVWAAGNPILKIDPLKLEIVDRLELPSASCSGGKVGWGAWRPTSLCAGTQNNCIYWDEADFGFCRYDIDKDETTTNLFTHSGYGVSRIEPTHDYYASVAGTISTMQREQLLTYSVNVSYLFQSHPFFGDFNKPAVLTNQIVVRPGEARKICLSDMVYDADDASKLALKTLSFDKTDASVASCSVKNDTLYLTGGAKEGYTTFDMSVCSHGIETYKNDIQILVKEDEAIE